MNVDPHVLAASSAEVDIASQHLVAAHDGTGAAIGPALDGWVGLSRAAMSDTAAQWSATTVAVAARMTDLADALAVSGRAFAAMDARHAVSLAAVRAPAEVSCR